MGDEFNAKHGNVIAIPFYKTNLTTGEANTDMLLPSAGTLHTMPKAGSVVGISLRVTEAISAGTITGRVHSSGTEIATTGYPTAVLGSASTGSYGTVRPGALTFSAGAALGISVTTTTTLDATDTLDIDGLLFVVLDPD